MLRLRGEIPILITAGLHDTNSSRPLRPRKGVERFHSASKKRAKGRNTYGECLDGRRHLTTGLSAFLCQRGSVGSVAPPRDCSINEWFAP